jgi:hypothetical protein
MLNVPTPSASSLIWGILLGAGVTLFLSVELRALMAKLIPSEKSTA